MVFFSIIIPTKNRCLLLKECINSILNQTYSDFEVIIVDDKSDDGTIKMIDLITDKRIRYINNKSTGEGDGRNTGIDNAKGKYICFVDDDDWVEKDFLLAFYDAIKKDSFNGEVLRTGFNIITENKTIKSLNYLVKKHNNPIQYCLFNMCSVCTLCIAKEKLETIKFDPKWPLWTDTHFLLRFFLNNELIQLPSYSYNYRLHSLSISNQSVHSDLIMERAKLNTDAMKDVFNKYGAEIFEFVPKNSLNYILAEKYLQYAINDLKYAEAKNYGYLLTSSLKSKFDLRFTKNYLYFLFQLLKSKI